MAGNLPAQPTTFVGRASEIAEVRELLGRSRLVTITGTGGAGKTRLAVEVARALEPACPDGVWLVELGAIPASGIVAGAVAAAIGVREEAGRPLDLTLVEHLSDRQALVVLDNCEHVLRACGQIAGRLVAACRGLRVLATSREVLGIEAETPWRLLPLELPAGPASVDGVMASEATRLFVERARRHRPGFEPTDESAAAIVQVCRRLDGLPLPIELAAARIEVLSPRQIADRLDDRFRLLTGGSPERPPHQQTLRGTMDWSYELLAPAERMLLARLSVFPAGCTIEAAHRMSPETDELGVIDVVSGLVRRSLAVVEDRGAQARYRLLETVRAYGADKLDESGERDAVLDRFLAWCIELAEEAERELSGTRGALALEHLESEHENLRAGLGLATDERPDPDAALRLAAVLWRFWHIRGHFTEGRAWLARVLALDGGDPVLRPKVLNGAGSLAWRQGDFDSAVSFYTQALDLSRRLGLRRGAAAALNNLGSVAHQRGDYGTATAWYEESVAIARELGDDQNVTACLINLGSVAYSGGDAVRAREIWQEALSMAQLHGFVEWKAHTLNNLAMVALGSRALDEAAQRWNEALGTFEELGDSQGMAMIVANLSGLEAERGRLDRATELAARSITMHRDLGDRLGLASCLENMARFVLALGEPERAAFLLGAADARREEIGASLPPAEQDAHDRNAASAADAIGAEEFAYAWGTGHTAGLDRVIERATQAAAQPEHRDGASFRMEGEFWTITFEGRVSRLKDAKGFHYIARLLGSPGREFHVLDLLARDRGATRRRPDELEVAVDDDAGAVLDEQSKAAYRERLNDLREELAEAEAWDDAERAAQARAELEAIAQQLAAGVGLGGRDRKAASATEKARLNVTRAVRAAQAKIAAANPELGRHLEATLRTGIFCSYTPDPRAPLRWSV